MDKKVFYSIPASLRIPYLVLMTVAPISLTAIEPIYRTGAIPTEQKSDEFEKLEKSLDARIKAMAQRIENLQVLRQFKQLEMSPHQTYFTIDPKGETLEVTDYSFGTIEPKPEVSAQAFGVRNLRFIFKGNKLVSIQAQITKMSLDKSERTYSSFVHQNPTSEAADTIVVEKVFNETEKHTVKVGEMENTISFPYRIIFKRDFYLALLSSFEDHLRATLDWHRKKASNSDRNVINHLKAKSGY